MRWFAHGVKTRHHGFANGSAWKAAALEYRRADGLAPFAQGQMHRSLLGGDGYSTVTLFARLRG